MAKRILLVGGGSGGHVYPLSCVARAVRDYSASSGQEVIMEFLGDGNFLADVSENVAIPYHALISGKIRSYFSFKNFLDVFKFPVSFFQSLFYVWRFMPDVVFSKGGYSSVMPVIVARIFLIPVFIHESDAIPGRANRFLAIFARKVFVSFENSIKYFNSAKTELVGNPVRPELLGAGKDTGLAAFKLSSAKPTVLFLGGSQGALLINNVVVESLVELVNDFQIIHQCGEKNLELVKKQIEQTEKEGSSSYGKTIQDNYRLSGFFDVQQMALAYGAADLVVSRAGANSIFEIAALAKPVILIPLKTAASGHQLANAQELAKFGATIIEEENLTTHILINEIKETYQSRGQISSKMKEFPHFEPQNIIVQRILAD